VKAEYCNLFEISANNMTNEVVITLKQETVRQIVEHGKDGSSTVTHASDTVEVSAVAMTMENAKQLHHILGSMLQHYLEAEGKANEQQ